MMNGTLVYKRLLLLQVGVGVVDVYAVLPSYSAMTTKVIMMLPGIIILQYTVYIGLYFELRIIKIIQLSSVSA